MFNGTEELYRQLMLLRAAGDQQPTPAVASTGNKYFLSFRSLGEVIDFAERSGGINETSRRKEINEWTDNYGFDDFIDDFRNFHNKNKKEMMVAEVTSILEKYIEQYKHHFVPQCAFEEVLDKSGGAVDIGSYLEGNPDCMLDFISREDKKTYNIVYQGNASVYKCEKIELIGIISYCLGKLLGNRAFNLYSACNLDNKIHICIPVILASHTNIYPQIELLLLNQKAFSRRIMFALYESFPDNVRDDIGIRYEGGYGTPLAPTKEGIIKYFDIEADLLVTDDFNLDSNLDSACHEIIKSLITEEPTNAS